MSATDTGTISPADLRLAVLKGFSRKQMLAFGVPALILVYLAYVFFAFDIPGIASRARLDNAAILLSDFWSHKTHVTRDNRTDEVTVAIEGENKGTYPQGMLPDWVTMADGVTRIDLDGGHEVIFDGDGARYTVPGYGVIDVSPHDGKLRLVLPDGPVPDWINPSDTRVSVTTPEGRFSYTRNRTEVFKYQAGWELFFFTLDSPFYGKSFVELVRLATVGERVDPDRTNISAMVHDFWTNAMWRHGDVAWALFETVLMAFLGTMGAAVIALPLAFFAATNFTPSRPILFTLRRVFDFLRGVDGLIWTIILSRAFGPGPMTGALAILLTDTGTFGKTFSEALENIDARQVEGVQSTGASRIQQARFGVIPQVTPVFLSQVLYYLESNTRSATVIGAIVGGGIGLLLTQAIATQKDWEEVSYYIVLIVLMVMAMDTLSGWLRSRLIGRTGHP
ncbi:phosphonate ABC transporter permease [Hoeflea sp. BAL378]|uniref:phosphonate ABC transporter, permease protein PhnE n=1 Tax=Hoeflea sp. BAL378 TaxID=1547437 RepID=UPI0005133E60|nr:phosphonate ABC transporter, permease protein PhnE [Hoeflea sp. BAL378]KGF69695.1 phosphonate ABC transporter permease [Hoeflea sp. BAL378]